MFDKLIKQLVFMLILSSLLFICIKPVFADSASSIGDADFDGKVNMTDLARLSLSYGSSTGDSRFDASVDFDGNGRIDTIDFTILKQNFGYDVLKPAIAGFPAATSATSIVVHFSEKVNKDTAENIGNYIVAMKYGSKSSLVVTKAELDAEGTKITLTTASQDITLYEIKIQNIADPDGNMMDNYTSTFVGILPDLSKPSVTSVTSESYSTIKIQFSEPVNSSTVQNPANYSLNNGLTITSVQFDSSNNIVTLTTALQPAGQVNMLVIRNIQDISGNIMDEYTAYLLYATAPKAIAANAKRINLVEVTFSEKVEPISAQNIGNYTSNNGMMILNAALDITGRVATLTTSAQNSGQYAISVRNVLSLSGNVVYNDGQLNG
jgi:hypothetical protein